jgi:chaperonin GroES
MAFVKPVHDRVLIKKDDPNTVSAGGIVIPEFAAGKSTKGTVMAAGPGKYSEKTAILIPMTVKVGDRVLFHEFAGTQLNIGEESYYCMPESDVWCVIEEE